MLLILAAAACMAVSHISPKSIFKGLKPMIFIIILTGALNIFYTTGTPVLPGWIITWEGIIRAVKMILRIVLLITGTFLLTYTTSPMALTDGLELLMNPLKKIKVPVHEMTIMMSMALRFIPTLIEETDKIMSAQRPHKAGQGPAADSGAAVCVGFPPGGRAGGGYGEPLLPRRPGADPDETAPLCGNRLRRPSCERGIPGWRDSFEEIWIIIYVNEKHRPSPPV